jgi:NTE family protein
VLAAARRPWGVRPGAVLSSLLPAGRASTAALSRRVNQMHGDRWPARDLRLCAVRARDARRVVFGAPDAPQVDVGTAVAASCAIPAWFAPVRVDGEAYVDGGAHSPSNADVLLPDNLDLVVISSPMSFGRGGGRPALDTGVRLVVRRYLAREVRRLRAAGTRVVVLQPTLEDLSAMGANMMDGSRAADVLRAASASTQARLQAQPELHDLLA